jgi:antitoxin component YwqK of YwqJK toxin-antitoxin module
MYFQVVFKATMKLLSLILLWIPFTCFGQSFKDYLVEINTEWENYTPAKPQHETPELSTDIELISYHFENVLPLLRSRPITHLSFEQQLNRAKNLQHLNDYRNREQYPKNLHHTKRVPCFIDDEETACAVAYLMQTSGDSALATSIATSENFDYVKEIENPGLFAWQKQSGLTVEELALIQPTYGPPPVPGPVCGARYIPKQKNEWGYINGNVPLYYRGRCTGKQLHGSWKVWNADSVFLVKGTFVNGKKEGKWMESGDAAHPLSSRNAPGMYGTYLWNITGATTKKQTVRKPKPESETPIRFNFGDEHQAIFYYIDGLKQGKYRSYNKEGNLVRKGQFEDDYRHGTWSTYQNGKLIAQHSYDRGDLHGKEIHWDENGKVYSESNYYYGQQNGSVKEYRDGVLIQYNRYKNNQLHGLTLRYDHNGIKKEEELFEKGQSQFITKWSQGVAHKTAEITAKYIKAENIWVTTETRWFDEAPIVKFEGHYMGNLYQYKRHYSGKPDRYGKHTTYHLMQDEKGAYYRIVAETSNFNEKGQLHGESKAYRKDGSLYANLEYRNGTQVNGYIEKDDTPGQLRSEFKTDNSGLTEVTHYEYHTGKKEQTGHYKDYRYIKTGTWIYFDEHENVKRKVDFEHGNQIRERIYFPNGQLSANYGRNKMHPTGPFVEYFENGQLKTEGSYMENSASKIGVWKYMNEEGQLEKEEFHNRGEDLRTRTFRTVLFYPNEKKKEAFTSDYKMVKSDTSKTWNESGQLLSLEIHGPRNRPIGIWKYFYTNGKPLMVFDYNNWTKGISVEEFFPSGKLKHRYQFRLNTATKNQISLTSCVSYDENGKTKRELYYDKTHLYKSINHETSEYYTAGHPNSSNYTREMNYRWPTGGVHYNYRLDKEHCRIYGIERDQLGNITAQGAYYKGIKNGNWKYYNKTDIVRTEQHTIADSALLTSSVTVLNAKNIVTETYSLNSDEIRIGPYIRYHKNGKKAVSGSYSNNGDKVGRWTYYNRKEKVIKEVFPEATKTPST